MNMLKFTDHASGPPGGNMDHRLLEIIACPVCNGKLYYSQDKQELICKVDSLAYPVREGIPVLLENEARSLTEEESRP
jgi:uncharacterized protein YbaR (Trm112 family)